MRSQILGMVGSGALIVGLTSSAGAYEYEHEYGSDTADHTLSVAGGIAVGSPDLAAIQNPAAFVDAPSLALDLEGMDNYPQNGGAGGGLLFGGGPGSGWGAGVGLQDLDFGSGGGVTRLDYGIGASIAAETFSFGIGGVTGLSGGGGTSLNLGGTYRYSPDFSVSGMLDGFNESGMQFGGGFSYAFAAEAHFIVDATADNGFNHLAVSPGLLVGNSRIAATVSYGIKLSGDGFGSFAFRDGVAGGIRVAFDEASLSVYYDQPQYSRFYASLTLDL